MCMWVVCGQGRGRGEIVPENVSQACSLCKSVELINHLIVTCSFCKFNALQKTGYVLALLEKFFAAWVTGLQKSGWFYRR